MEAESRRSAAEQPAERAFRRVALDRQLVVTRPLVPGAGIVARPVAGPAEGERGERRAGARMAVRDDLRALGQPDRLADRLGGQRLPRPGEQLLEPDAARA